MPPHAEDGAGGEDLRVLIASHSHPRVQNGGSEVASYSLFDRLRQQPGLRAWYCGCSRTASFARAGQSITQPFERDEYLYTVGDFEWFKFANRDTAFARDFRALLRNLRPQIVHFHHYINFGMEAFAHVREVLPDAKLVLTLHEFLAICHQQGQMVTRHGGKLCRRSGQVECSRCFPEFQPADFFLRETYIGHFLRHVHQFISPSRFLAERYVAWGLPAERISVIENVPAAIAARRGLPARRVRSGPDLRVGFFGQISLLKGIQVLIDAAAILDGERRHDIAFQIHGDQSNQPAAFQAEFLAQMEKAGGNVSFHGAYANADIGELMAEVDLVLVPSIWWENSPVVIQEAYRNGVPVVCSNIGGMAEKVVPDETGLHFQVGSPRSLAGVLKALADDPDRLARLAAGAARDAHLAAQRDEPDPGPATADPLGAHLRLYRDLRTPSPPRPAPRFGLSRDP